MKELIKINAYFCIPPMSICLLISVGMESYKTYCVSLNLKIEKIWTVYKFKLAKKQIREQNKFQKNTNTTHLSVDGPLTSYYLDVIKILYISDGCCTELNFFFSLNEIYFKLLMVVFSK